MLSLALSLSGETSTNRGLDYQRVGLILIVGFIILCPIADFVSLIGSTPRVIANQDLQKEQLKSIVFFGGCFVTGLVSF